MLTAFSGAKETIGFNKNPLSFLFSKKIPHDFDIDHPRHEIEKNNGLVQHFTNEKIFRPALYPSASDYDTIQPYAGSKYVTMTPSSVWFTKQYPAAKWINLINAIPAHVNIYLLGGKENIGDCDQIIQKSAHTSILNLAGKLSFLQSAAMMEAAAMNYVNDSAPLHFASAMNAPVTAIFCSTIPEFGYTPLSDISHIVETSEKLPCRPCGLHGKKACPEGHFKCGFTIKNEQLLEKLVL